MKKPSTDLIIKMVKVYKQMDISERRHFDTDVLPIDSFFRSNAWPDSYGAQYAGYRDYTYKSDIADILRRGTNDVLKKQVDLSFTNFLQVFAVTLSRYLDDNEDVKDKFIQCLI